MIRLRCGVPGHCGWPSGACCDLSGGGEGRRCEGPARSSGLKNGNHVTWSGYSRVDFFVRGEGTRFGNGGREACIEGLAGLSESCGLQERLVGFYRSCGGHRAGCW